MKIHLAKCLLLAAALPLACRAPAQSTAEPEPSVEGAHVKIPPDSPQNRALAIQEAREARPAPLHLNGRLAWDENVSVRVYSPFGGRVTEVLVQPSQAVERGAVLARIASSEYAKAESDAHKAASKLRLAERTLSRVSDLQEHGAAALKELEVAEAEQIAARSEDQRARARLAAYGSSGASAVDGSFALRSPIGGVVVERILSPGQEVRNDQIMAGTPQLAAPLFTITDPSRLWVVIDASEHDAPLLHPGDPFAVRLHLDSSVASSGRIETVSNFLDPVSRTVRARGSVKNPDAALRAEMFVTVDVEPANATPVPEVPVAAVLLEGDRHYLYVAKAPGQFERREVSLGSQDGDWLPVVGGLAGGSRVVSGGAILLEKIYQDHIGS